MKRRDLLSRELFTPLDAIQTCRDIVEGNVNAWASDPSDYIELTARIFTDFEILATNQARRRYTTSISETARLEEEAAGSAEQYAEGTAIAEDTDVAR
jgi:hypothetical protein